MDLGMKLELGIMEYYLDVIYNYVITIIIKTRRRESLRRKTRFDYLYYLWDASDHITQKENKIREFLKKKIYQNRNCYDTLP